MASRSELKGRGKLTLKANYWGSVIAAWLGTILISGGGSASVGAVQGDEDLQGSLSGIVDGLTEEEAIAILMVLLAIIAVLAVIGLILNIFVGNPLRVGANHFFLTARGKEKLAARESFFAFKHGYGNVVKSMFLRDLFVGLWSLLLIIPGVIKAYQWMMVPYILAENPDMDAREARELSRAMMDGHKWEYFVLQLSFFGWQILGVCTLGLLLFFWVNPYMEHTLAEFYVERKAGGGQSQLGGAHFAEA